MPSRRDHVDAYRSARRRVLRALVLGRPDDEADPLRRTVRTAVGSVVVAGLLLVVVLLYSLVRPQHDLAWRTDRGAVVIVEGSAARYVYLGGTLHPVLNESSALLALGSGAPAPFSVAESELATTPRGATLGIPGAPDRVVPLAALAPASFAACSGTAATGGTAPGAAAAVPVTLAVVGRTAPAGQRLTTDGAVLVRTGAGTTYLLVGDHRLLVSTAAVLAPLGLNQTRPRPVSTSWADTVPRGPDLAFPAVPGRPGSQVTGARVPASAARVGQVSRFHPVEGRDQWFVTTAAGLAPTSFTAAQLVLADPRLRGVTARGVPRAVELGAADVSASTVAARFGPSGWPDAAPSTDPGRQAGAGWVCLDWTGTSGGASSESLTAAADPPLAPGGRPQSVGRGAPGRSTTADEVWVAPGSAALLDPVDSADEAASAAQPGEVDLVSEEGLRYPVDADGLDALGYADALPVRLPRELVALVPVGPDLTPAAARQTWQLPPGATAPTGAPVPAPGTAG